MSGRATGRAGLVRAVASRDLRAEARGRVVTNQIVPFAGLVMVTFAFALDREDVLSRAAGGLLWLATTFSLFVLVQRAFALETADRALDALRVAGVDLGRVYLGKSIALMVQLFALECVLVPVAVVLYRVRLDAPGAVLLVTCMVSATAGLAFVGTLYGGLTVGGAGRETLLPLLVLPVVAPVLIAATRATESALRSGGAAVSEGWAWVGLLAVFAAAFGIAGTLAFGPLVDE
ncbi:MAG: cytochrome c-type biosis protein CcmB [Actinomycetota bacterium]|jgi:heme exporter protein B